MTMKIWTLNADSESGDHYRSLTHWDHKPDKKEIYEALADFFMCDDGTWWEYPDLNNGKEHVFDGESMYPTVYWSVDEGELNGTR